MCMAVVTQTLTVIGLKFLVNMKTLLIHPCRQISPAVHKFILSMKDDLCIFISYKTAHQEAQRGFTEVSFSRTYACFHGVLNLSLPSEGQPP